MLQTIAAAHAALRAGRTSAEALVEASLAAVAAHQSRTNAFITVAADAARTAARAVDRERAAGIDRGPLHGIPISLKDLIDEAGAVTTAASRVPDRRPAQDDAPLVARLREAGAIVIGRTNLHEFAMGTTSEDSAFGPVRHPADAARFAGGSSGGSAAAVATGMGLASIGTDTGGSIRIPAALCGIVGLKPSRGEVPVAGIVPLSATLDTAGPLTIDVQDAAWVYAVVAGQPPFTVEAVPAARLRLARLGGYFDHLQTEVRDAFDRALTSLSGGGTRIGQVTIPDAERTAEIYLHLALPEAARAHAAWLDSRAASYTPAVHARIASGRETPAAVYQAARAFADVLAGQVDAALEACDALVLPTEPLVAQPLGTMEVPLDRLDNSSVPLRAAMLRHTQLFNLTGHPAISLPVPTDGLPVGLQLVGRRGRTAALLAVAKAVEMRLSQAA